MRLVIPTSIKHIQWTAIFEGWYVLTFVVLFLGSIIFSTIVFYTMTSTTPDNPSSSQRDATSYFSEKNIKDIQVLLDAREDRLNKLRNSKPTIRNPF